MGDSKEKGASDGSQSKFPDPKPKVPITHGDEEIGIVMRRSSAPTNVSSKSSTQPVQKNHDGLVIGDYLEDRGEFYRIEQKLTFTALGILYRARNWRSQRPVIIKQFITAYFNNPESGENDCEKYWIREQKIIQQQSLSPVSTVHLLGAIMLTNFKFPEYYLIITIPTDEKKIEWTQLDTWVKKNISGEKALTVKKLRQLLDYIFIPLALHIGFIHDQGIVHRDISPKNIVIVDVSSKPYPMIVDWGMAKDLPLKQLFKPPKPYFQKQAPLATLLRMIGAPPEVVDGYEPVAATDIYMLASIIRFIITGGKRGKMPMNPEDYIIRLETTDPNFPPTLIKLVEEMTQYEPADRLSDAAKVRERLQKTLKELSKNEDAFLMTPTEFLSVLIQKQPTPAVSSKNPPKTDFQQWFNALSNPPQPSGEVAVNPMPSMPPKSPLPTNTNYTEAPVSTAKPLPLPKIDDKAKTRHDAELKARQGAELKARQDAELKAKQDAELKAKQDAELKAKQDAELKAKQDAELKVKQEAELKIKQDIQENSEIDDFNDRDRTPLYLPPYLLDRLVGKSKKYLLSPIATFERMNRAELEDASEHLSGERIKFDESYENEKAVLDEMDFRLHHLQARLQILIESESEALLRKLLFEPIEKGSFKKYIAGIGPSYSVESCAQDIIDKVGRGLSKIPLSEMAIRNKLSRFLETRLSKAET